MTDVRLDRAALVWGALFTVTGATFLGQEWGWWTVQAGVLVPLLLIVAGSVLLLAGLVQREVSP